MFTASKMVNKILYWKYKVDICVAFRNFNQLMLCVLSLQNRLIKRAVV